MMNKLKTWHIDLIEKVQKHTGLSNYQIIWLSFAEGLIIGLFIGYLLVIYWLFYLVLLQYLSFLHNHLNLI